MSRICHNSINTLVFTEILTCSPGWCGSVDWAWTWKPKGHWFNSQSGHMPGFPARCPVGGVQEATTHWCFSPSLSLKKKKILTCGCEQWNNSTNTSPGASIGLILLTPQFRMFSRILSLNLVLVPLWSVFIRGFLLLQGCDAYKNNHKASVAVFQTSV